MYVAKTKELISCEVTAQLICAFVFAYAKSRFSHHDAAQGENSYILGVENFLILQYTCI